MRTSWRIGRLFGIDINIDSSWILIFVLFSWSMAAGYFPRQYPDWTRGLAWAMGVMTSLLVFGSVLVHELAHSLVAIKQGGKVRSITLFLLGGVAQISEEPKAPLQEFRMASVGPLTSFVLAGLFFLASILLVPLSRPLHASARYLALINIALGVFNLLPGFPLDGGRVLRSIIWKVTGDLKKATRAASLSGQAFAFLFIFLGLLRFLMGDLGGLWLVFIGWFLHSASVRGYDQVAVRSALRGLTAGTLMTKDFETVHPGLSVQKLVDEHILAGKGRVFLVTSLGGDLQGIVCLEDVKGSPRDRWPSATVGEIMTPRDKLQAVAPEADGNEVLARLTSRDVHEIPVMESGKLVGIICRTDILRELQLRNELGLYKKPGFESPAGRIPAIIALLRREFPDTRTALEFRNPFQILVATILAAQSTDEQVNKITPALFAKYPTAGALAAADRAELEKAIHSTGFFRNKAKSLLGAAKCIVEVFGGKVPDAMEDLVTLPGVARKTANIVLSAGYGKSEGIAVDTHVRRLAGRLGLSRETVPEKIERDLMAIVPRKEWLDFNFLLVDHGRKTCRARNPDCPACVIRHLCPSAVLFHPELERPA